MAQSSSITEMIITSLTMSEDEKDSRLLWRSHVSEIDTICNLRDNLSKDCVIIVGETKIPVDKAVVQLNSSMLTESMSSSVRDGENGVTEIEVESTEFEDQADMVKDIVDSFYSGEIDIDEAVLKKAYKFSTVYEIRWLKIHTSHLIINYLTKSMHECYERFKEIFTIAHFIWDNDLFETCILMIDKDILELLIGDEEMLEKITYRCMEIITKSPNVEFPEKKLFDLVVAWATCKKQEHKEGFQQLFENLRYKCMDKRFIVDRVLTYVYENEGIFSVSIVKNLRDGFSESPKDACRSEPKKVAFAGQMVIHNLKSLDKTLEEKVKEVNTFLILKDIQYVPDKIMEELSETIASEEDISSSLDWLSMVNLITHHQTASTARILVLYTNFKLKRAVSEYYELDWTKVTDKAITCLLEEYKEYPQTSVDIAMSWCLANRGSTDDANRGSTDDANRGSTDDANRGSTDDATLERITSLICYNAYNDVYKSDILSPTIKHLLPEALPGIVNTKPKCKHAGDCNTNDTMTWRRKTAIDEKLYKLEPFEDTVATLSDNNGVLELTFKADLGVMFNKDNPCEPFYPPHCKIVDDGALRRFVASLKEGDKICILEC